MDPLHTLALLLSMSVTDYTFFKDLTTSTWTRAPSWGRVVRNFQVHEFTEGESLGTQIVVTPHSMYHNRTSYKGSTVSTQRMVQLILPRSIKKSFQWRWHGVEEGEEDTPDISNWKKRHMLELKYIKGMAYLENLDPTKP